jgi:hypothetical protein
MTYPPGNPGYPPAQSPGSYGAPAASSFAKTGDADNNLKHYLTIAVAVLGVAAYLLSFADLFSASSDELQVAVKLAGDLPYGIGAALLAALLAGVNLISKKNYLGVVAAISVWGALDVITFATNQPSGLQIAWPLWLILGLASVQAIVAISALLLDAGVITAPAPRPKYDQYYGQYGGYYGQQQAPYQQSGYGTQYGGYPSGPTTGGFAAQPGPQPNSAQSQHGSPTPPTGFPSFSPPPSSGSGAPGQGGAGDQGGSVHSQHSYGSGQAPSSPSGPPPS